MQNRHSVTIDLGTCLTSICVSNITAEGAQVCYFKSLPSEGIADGQVKNILKCRKVLSTLIQDAEKELEVKIQRVMIAYPRFSVSHERITNKIERSNPDQMITADELSSLCQIAMDNFKKGYDEKTTDYCYSPLSYNIDDFFQAPADQIIGATSRYIEVNLAVFSGSLSPLSNIKTMMEALQIDYDYVFTPQYTASLGLSEEELQYGVALVEIGGGVSSVSIWNAGNLCYYGSFPFAGKSVTDDIKNDCAITEDTAEFIKKKYGICKGDILGTLADKMLLIEGTTENKLPVKHLSEIIKARMEEIANGILYLIADSGYADKLRSGIVLCGGGSVLTGCCEMMRELSGIKVRNMVPQSKQIETCGYSEMSHSNSLQQLSLITGCINNQVLDHISVVDKTAAGQPEQPGQSGQEEGLGGMTNIFGEVEPQPVVKPKAPKRSRPAFLGNLGKNVKKTGEQFVAKTGELFSNLGRETDLNDAQYEKDNE